jgi:hypothetical protein
MNNVKKVINVKVGQVWAENDRRRKRRVVVLSKEGKNFFRIKTVSRNGEKAGKVRETLANQKRFNGRLYGYSLVKDAK